MCYSAILLKRICDSSNAFWQKMTPAVKLLVCEKRFCTTIDIQRYCHCVPFDKKLACITNYREKQSFTWPLVCLYLIQAKLDRYSTEIQMLMSPFIDASKRSDFYIIPLEVSLCFWYLSCGNIEQYLTRKRIRHYKPPASRLVKQL